MKTMKKLPFFVLALLFLMGCQAKPATDDTDDSTRMTMILKGTPYRGHEQNIGKFL